MPIFVKFYFRSISEYFPIVVNVKISFHASIFPIQNHPMLNLQHIIKSAQARFKSFHRDSSTQKSKHKSVRNDDNDSLWKLPEHVHTVYTQKSRIRMLNVTKWQYFHYIPNCFTSFSHLPIAFVQFVLFTPYTQKVCPFH